MYNVADKMITGCKFDFAIFAILTLQIPIACFDMLRAIGIDLFPKVYSSDTTWRFDH